MRAAVFDSDGRLAIEERPTPVVGPGEVRVRVDACGICGSDLHARRLGTFSPGTIPGHEIAGRVDAIGPALSGAQPLLEIDQSVVVEPLSSCGRCKPCQMGRDSICPELEIAGIDRPGGFADFIVVPTHRVYPVESQLPAGVAALAEPLAVALHVLDRCRFVAGERVAILGAGPVGLLCGAAAREAGAAEVWIEARYPSQRALALRLGLTCLAEGGGAAGVAAGDLEGFEIVLETVGGGAETLIEAGTLANPGGRIGILGLFDFPPRIDPQVALAKELSFAWSNCYARPNGRSSDFAEAVALLEASRLPWPELLTHHVSLDRIEEAFDLATQKCDGVSKVAVVPSLAEEPVFE